MLSRVILFLGMTLTIGFFQPLHAQTSLGQIDGTVTDQSGAVIPGATVTLTQVGTQQVHTATTNGSGFYVAPNLPIGEYTVEVHPTRSPA